jgi:signal transduction histidine kinase
MNNRIAASEDGIRFFGRVTASISHEINNVLAVIYENAGLVEDLLSAAERGRPLDPSRIKDLAGRLKAQVRRGKGIVENMNRFAHSVDEPLNSLDLRELLTLTVSLARRVVSMREFEVEVEKVENPVQVRTDPFLLQNLVWLCLDYLMEASDSPHSIRLVPEAASNEARIRFTGMKHAVSGAGFPTQRQEILMRALGARLRIDEESGEIILSIPHPLF